MNDSALSPANLNELRALFAGEQCLLPVGNQTKPPLSACQEATLVSLRRMRGIIEYEPSEFTFTARAGTPVAEIEAALVESGQYLPFDPLLVDAGATIGGTVAAGLSGPGRFRYGGVRDFFLGVQFISGDGNVINAGGKVVKNAAGFDIPKFLVGSLGRFGMMTELTFKVFPRPIATRTLRVDCGAHRQAIERIAKAACSRWELDAIDYRPDQQSLFLRLAGSQQVNESISREIRSTWGEDVSDGELHDPFWRSIRELNWSQSVSPVVVKVPATAAQFPALYDSLAADDRVSCHWSVAGSVLWISLDTSEQLSSLDAQLQSLVMAGLVVRGDCDAPQIGTWPTNDMQAAVKAAMDPPAKFPDVPLRATAGIHR